MASLLDIFNTGQEYVNISIKNTIINETFRCCFFTVNFFSSGRLQRLDLLGGWDHPRCTPSRQTSGGEVHRPWRLPAAGALLVAGPQTPHTT